MARKPFVPKPNALLRKEAEQVQYALRSSFFYARRRDFNDLCIAVDHLDVSCIKWGRRKALGISESSWDYLSKNAIPHHQVFVHPKLLQENPRLVAYYRSLALLSQKGLQRLAFGTQKLEEGKGRLTKQRALILAKTLNGLISSIVDSDIAFSVPQARLAAQANYGTQINGSWRNAIGEQGKRSVNSTIVKHFIDKEVVTEAELKDGSHVSSANIPSDIDTVRGFKLSNGYSVVFASEPDISIRNPQGILEAAIEVKAALDPAGAFERYGAAKKSFDKVLTENKAAITIYLSTCIIDSVHDLMATDRSVRKEFNLTRIFVDQKARDEFLKYLQWIMHL
jgi:hypothetical protein